MKGIVIGALMLVIGLVSFPLVAQQLDTQTPTNPASTLGVRQSEMLKNKDAAGIASLFTSDGVVVMLAPKLAVKSGHEAIQKHYEGLIAAGATNITLEVQEFETRGDDAAWAAGTYSVTVKEKTIEGNWFRLLLRDGDTWRIAVETFARPSPIDTPAVSANPSTAAATGK
jgi:uncharacterized protein (TIGR02246 family)